MFGVLAGATIGSALIGADASKSGANAMVGASDRATAATAAAAATTRADLSPFVGAGTDALRVLSGLSGLPQKAGVDWNAYLQANPDVAKDPYFAQHPDEHYAKYGQSEGRQVTMLPTDGSNLPGGAGAMGSLTKPFDYSLTDFYKDPSYQFQLDEGTKALTRANSAAGLVASTPGLRSLMQFNQDYAGTSYGAAFNRAFGVDQSNKQTTYNFLSGIAGMGQNAAAMTGSTTMAGANTAASAMLTGGAAAAGGITGSAASVNNALQGGLGNYMYNLRYQQTMGLYSNLLNGKPAPAGGGGGGGGGSPSGSALSGFE